MLIPLLTTFFIFCSADDLVQIQVVYRHGDRTPLQCFPTDPNLPVWNLEPKGEFTTIGMRQHYNQGLKMKARYIDQLKFLNSTYKREEILVRSSMSPRCIQSSASNLAGLYSGSKGTFPANAGWPTNWTPIPIHSLEPPLQHMLDPGKNCLRDDTLTTKRGADNEAFVTYEFDHAEMIAEIADLSGEGILDIQGLMHFYDCVRIEKEFRNMSLAKWVTPKLYNNLADLYWRTANYIYGGADFGVGEDLELIRVRGGALLTEILDRMMDAAAGKDATKMYAYSAHDTTLTSLFRTLGNKKEMVGDINPDYAAHYIFELWKSGVTYYIKTLYLANETADFVTTTSNIRDCGGGDTCPFPTFNERCKPYLVNHIQELCDKAI